MKLMFVIQRYGTDIVGGAELHCRLIAERLAKLHDVEIVTTCASSYLTWENTYPEGSSKVNGIPVHRFRNERTKPWDFDTLAHSTLFGYPTRDEQIEYLEAHGPYCPSLINYLESRDDIDRFVLFSYRYWTAWETLRKFRDRVILVPTAEHDRVLYMDIHRESFLRPGAIAYNSHEERQLINAISSNNHVPAVTVGVGLQESTSNIECALDYLDLPSRFFLYIGRIEEAKGCCSLFKHFASYCKNSKNPVGLVLAGKQELNIPDHPGIFYAGVVSEETKLALLNKCEALVMPSRYESLSMVVLEAWKMKRPVLCNSHCEVLRGQCIRSNGGLYYRNTDEFVEGAELLTSNKDLGCELGKNGFRYYSENYTWSVVMEKYDNLLHLRGDDS